MRRGRQDGCGLDCTVAAKETFEGVPTELRNTAAAIVLATDFHQIADALSDVRSEPIARELLSAVRGKLFQQDDPQALTFRSQFFLGSVLLRAAPDVRLVLAARTDSRPS